MSNIIVGVDGSGHSQRALEYALKEAAIRHAPLTVVTVHEAIKSTYGGPVRFSDDGVRTEEARQAVQAETDKVLADLAEPRPESVTVTAVHGFPVDVLVTASKDADLLVLGSRGAGGFSRLMLGSVADQVVQHALCPVLIVPPQDRVAPSPPAAQEPGIADARLFASAPAGRPDER
jgi:nucleotide-binding universal stress UspA family protein